MEKFKLKGVGLDTTTIMVPTISEMPKDFRYFHVSLEAGNEYLFKHSLPDEDEAEIIMSIGFFEDLYESIDRYLVHLKTPRLTPIVGLLLFDSKIASDPSLTLPSTDSLTVKDQVEALRADGLVEEVGVMCPQSVADLEKWTEILGEKPEWIGLELCPVNFNWLLIKYCQANDIKIIGYNPLGGQLSSAGVIQAFSVPYLLAFSATYCDIVMLSGRDVSGLSSSGLVYLNSLIGRDTEPKYKLSKSISKLVKPYKKAIDTSLIINGDLKLGYTWPDILYDFDTLEFTLGAATDIIPDSLEDQSELAERVAGKLRKTSLPNDASLEASFSILRYVATEYLMFMYGPEWKLEIVRIGDRIVGLKFTKEVVTKGGWFKKDTVTTEGHSFLLAYPEYDVPVIIQMY